MGYIGAFGANLHPEGNKRTPKASAGPSELIIRVHGEAATTALRHIAWHITTDSVRTSHWRLSKQIALATSHADGCMSCGTDRQCHEVVHGPDFNWGMSPLMS